MYGKYCTSQHLNTICSFLGALYTLNIALVNIWIQFAAPNFHYICTTSHCQLNDDVIHTTVETNGPVRYWTSKSSGHTFILNSKCWREICCHIVQEPHISCVASSGQCVRNWSDVILVYLFLCTALKKKKKNVQKSKGYCLWSLGLLLFWIDGLDSDSPSL